jgi:hypothetical protein
MFDAPMDGLVLWVGLSAISLTVAGVALALPTATAPDAGPLARTIDDVATSAHTVETTVPIDAGRVRLRSARVSLRGDGGTGHATLVAADPVPVRNGSLRAVLAGRPPRRTFSSQAAFRRALARATGELGRWRPAPERLRIRRVSWGEVDATLVG